jgi:riboflavin kinase / FMN adenylyltransferase
MKVFHGLPDSPDLLVALTIGNFDGVHCAHQAMISLLKEAADRQNLPACVLTFEPHPKEFLFPHDAPRRLTNVDEKAALLESVGVDRLYVCTFDDQVANMAPNSFVSSVLAERLGVRWLLVGDDFRFGAKRAGDLALLRRLGEAFNFAVETMPTIRADGERVSSTAVREAFAKGNIARAVTLLGRPALLSGGSRVHHAQYC